MALRKVPDPSGKRYYLACSECPYESELIPYTMENYHQPPPARCPRCGHASGDDGVDFIPASSGV